MLLTSGDLFSFFSLLSNGFLLCDHGLDLEIGLCVNSINQSIELIVCFFLSSGSVSVSCFRLYFHWRDRVAFSFFGMLKESQ